MLQEHILIEPEEVGPESWNTLTEDNDIAFPYMQYEYISICSENNWKILSDQDRTFYIPIAFKNKLLFKHIFNPPFMQRIYALHKDENSDLLKLRRGLDFLKGKFQKIAINIDYDWPGLPSGFDKLNRRNYYHRYGQPVILNHHHQRNMRKAKVEHYSLDWNGDRGTLLKEYIKCTLSRRGKYRKKLSSIAEELLNWAAHEDILRIAFAKDRRGNAAAGIGLLHWKGRLINLLPFTSKAGWDGRAMYYLLFHLLKENPYNAQIFDFEGSEIPGVARFYKGFGPSKETYHSIYFEKHSFLIRIVNAATAWMK